MPVSLDREGDRAAARSAAPDDPATSPASPTARASSTWPCDGELEGVGEQVLENLLQALRIAREDARQVVVDVDVERQVLGLGDVAERCARRCRAGAERDLLGFDGDRARLDLREVENVVDQRQQVGAGGVDVARELDLLGRQVAAGVLGELLAENQDRVERRAQLVRHVGEELRLVLRGERQLGRLLLERAAGLLDFLVLALDFGVLLGELLGLRRQLLVGLLQLGLPGLQLDGQLLRLLQQALGAHRRFDGVEHDADRLRELLEEGQMRRGERFERRQLDHRLGLALEQHRQHDDVAAAAPRRDWSGSAMYSRGTLVSRMRCLSRAHWPTRPIADLDPLARWSSPMRVAGEQRQRRRRV